MDELRLVRRDDQSLVVATDAGTEYRLVVDETVLAELRALTRQTRTGAKVNPREVQSLVRAGKTREEIAAITGLDEVDIERYEEPVLAERRYILDLARAVPVRANANEEVNQEFGTAIAERLIGLDASAPEWKSWRDDEAGWMIGLNFTVRKQEHHAVWSFDHRKGLLAPITPDATNLSQQGDVGDRLIPKLRAVDSEDRFDSGAFDVSAVADDDTAHDLGAAQQSSTESGEATHDRTESTHQGGGGTAVSPKRFPSKVAPDHPSTGSIPIVDADAEFARRRHIEERAIKTPERELPDLGQTADLLDALRRRRGERESQNADADAAPRQPVSILRNLDQSRPGEDDPSGVMPSSDEHDTAEIEEIRSEREQTPLPLHTGPGGRSPEEIEHTDATPAEHRDEQKSEGSESRGKRGKGRASIPSWDDILFGTRSEDDPA